MDNYEIITTPAGNTILHRISDGAWIPMDESNGDYQEYLRIKQGTEQII